VGGTAFIKLPEKLAALPRKKTPVSSVPAGAVMFAAGIGSVVKPVDGPTGWHVIGKSPLKQWLPEKDPPLLILAGDRVRFQPVTEEEYQAIKKQVDAGTYAAQIIGT
jgi:inhibitor of KinA